MKAKPEIRLFEVLIHISGWVLLLGLPFIFLDHNLRGMDISWAWYWRHSGSTVIFLAAFYVNYAFLIPKFLFKNRKAAFWWLSLVLVVVMSVALYLWKSLVMAPYLMQAGFIPGPPKMPEPMMAKPDEWRFYLRDLLSMGVAVLLGTLIKLSMRWQQNELARQEAERERAAAELDNLRTQLQPHFLLNTLNNIYALIAFDTKRAQDAVQELSRLLRYVLYENSEEYVPLAREVDFVKSYIELMRLRQAEHVDVKAQFDLLSESKARIAPQLFISLVENAFKHGVSSVAPSFIRIAIREEADRVVCTIVNSNYPKASNDKSGSGIGLIQVRRRLELLYHGHYRWKTAIEENGEIYRTELVIDTAL